MQWGTFICLNLKLTSYHEMKIMEVARERVQDAMKVERNDGSLIFTFHKIKVILEKKRKSLKLAYFWEQESILNLRRSIEGIKLDDALLKRFRKLKEQRKIPALDVYLLYLTEEIGDYYANYGIQGIPEGIRKGDACIRVLKNLLEVKT